MVTKFVYPNKMLSEYIDNLWMLVNDADEDKEIIVLPDGRVDLFFSRSSAEPFQVTLLGVGTLPEKTILAARTKIFAISFRLPAIEYILKRSVAALLNGGEILPSTFWGFDDNDLKDFDGFVEKAIHQVTTRLPTQIDNRKQKLFKQLYATHGTISVNKLSDDAAWSSRQINRYFTEYFGLSLKTYCSILRFRASFDYIKEGKLFPDQHFSDQAHFIRETKKLAGVVPKELHRNKNDRFIQFSTLPPK